VAEHGFEDIAPYQDKDLAVTALVLQRWQMLPLPQGHTGCQVESLQPTKDAPTACQLPQTQLLQRQESLLLITSQYLFYGVPLVEVLGLTYFCTFSLP